MKRCIYIAMLASGLMQGAADDTTGMIIATCMTKKIPREVFNNMVNEGLEKVRNTQPQALESSVGAFYQQMQQRGGIDALCLSPSVVKKTNIYTSEIQADPYLQDLVAIAKELAGKDARVIALTALGFTYSALQKQLVESDVPGLKLRPTVQGTIEKNAALKLNEDETICLGAAQLSMGLNLQEQYVIDPKTFTRMFLPWIDISRPAQEAAPSSSSLS